MTRHKQKDFVRPLGVLPPPIGPLDGKWTASLVKRDIKNIYKAEKANIKTTMHNVFGFLRADTDLKPTQQSAVEVLRAHLNLDPIQKKSKQIVKRRGNAMNNTEDRIDPETEMAKRGVMVKKMNNCIQNEDKNEVGANNKVSSKGKVVKKKASSHIQKPSIDTIDSATSHVFTEPSSTPSTRNTDVDIHDTIPPIPSIFICSPPIIEYGNYYNLITDKLNAWYDEYKDERTSLSHEERFRNLGIIKFFRVVLECHASNPSYDKIRGNNPDPNQHAFLLRLFQLGIRPGSQFLPMSNQNVTQIACNLPSNGYSHPLAKDSCIDSAHNSVALALSQLYQNQGLGKGTDPVAVSRRWAAITAGLTDRSTSILAIAALMHGLWPYIDVDAYIIRIGDPAKGFGDKEDTKLRERLRPLLFPEYEQLFQCN